VRGRTFVFVSRGRRVCCVRSRGRESAGDRFASTGGVPGANGIRRTGLKIVRRGMYFEASVPWYMMRPDRGRPAVPPFYKYSFFFFCGGVRVGFSSHDGTGKG